MRRIILLCVIFVLPFLLFACTAITIPLHQELEDVSKIEILDTRGCSIYSENSILLYELQENEYSKLWNDLDKLKVARYLNDPPMEFGDYSIRIYYHNGCIQTISVDAITYYQPEKKSYFADYARYIENEDAFYALLEVYVPLYIE